jgi:hypothetical protein
MTAPIPINAPQEDAAIDRLISRLREHLYLPDPNEAYFFYGCVAANMIEGPPVWPMIVGQPGCGKTEYLKSIGEIPKTYPANGVKGEGSFLSATSKKDIAKDATGGLLKQVGECGALVMKDYTSIIAMDPKTAREIMQILRQCYDGHWDREVGVDGAKTMVWQGKLALYTGCTSAIDGFSSGQAVLGERFIVWRIPPIREQNYEKARRVLLNKPGWDKEVALEVACFFESLDLGYMKQHPRREFTRQRLAGFCDWGGYLLGVDLPVMRDWQSKEIIGPTEEESETRVTGALGHLYLGMELIEVPEFSRWKVLERVAKDSMPAMRRVVLDMAYEGAT